MAAWLSDATWWLQGTGGRTAQRLNIPVGLGVPLCSSVIASVSICLCLYFSVSQPLLSSFSFCVCLSLSSSVSPSVALHLSFSFSPHTSSPLPEPKASSITEPVTSNHSSLCTPLISHTLCALSPSDIILALPATIGCRYDSVGVGCDDQPHQLCLPATPTSYVLVFGEGTSYLEEHVVPLLYPCPASVWTRAEQRTEGAANKGYTGRGTQGGVPGSVIEEAHKAMLAYPFPRAGYCWLPEGGKCW